MHPEGPAPRAAEVGKQPVHVKVERAGQLEGGHLGRQGRVAGGRPALRVAEFRKGAGIERGKGLSGESPACGRQFPLLDQGCGPRSPRGGRCRAGRSRGARQGGFGLAEELKPLSCTEERHSPIELL